MMPITRREWIKMLPQGLMCGGCLIDAAAGKPKQYVLTDCPLAGFQFHGGLDIINTLRAGDRVALIAEPDNPHDADAVRVDHGTRAIGYLPRSHNKATAHLLKQGAPLFGRLTVVDDQSQAWDAVRLQVVIPM
jgi:hypothetical protein